MSIIVIVIVINVTISIIVIISIIIIIISSSSSIYTGFNYSTCLIIQSLGVVLRPLRSRIMYVCVYIYIYT